MNLEAFSLFPSGSSSSSSTLVESLPKLSRGGTPGVGSLGRASYASVSGSTIGDFMRRSLRFVRPGRSNESAAVKIRADPPLSRHARSVSVMVEPRSGHIERFLNDFTEVNARKMSSPISPTENSSPPLWKDSAPPVLAPLGDSTSARKISAPPALAPLKHSASMRKVSSPPALVPLRHTLSFDCSDSRMQSVAEDIMEADEAESQAEKGHHRRNHRRAGSTSLHTRRRDDKFKLRLVRA